MKVLTDQTEKQLVQRDGHWLPETEGEYSIEKIDDDKLFIIVNGRTYTAECLSVNRTEKTVELLLNGQKIHTRIKEPLDDLLHSMGLDKIQTGSAGNIKAPMPGLVLDVAVEPGVSVSKGDKVLVLEAMKMENIIKAGGDGIVARVLVQKGQTVDKNQILIEFS